MMQSISHWGQFEMQAAGTENFRELPGAVRASFGSQVWVRFDEF